jgi:hypothetical protein
MAVTDAGAQLTAAHRQAQLQIRAQALQAYVAAWPLWHGDETSFQGLLDVVAPLIRATHGLSASLAASYFTAFRAAEQIPGDSAPVLAATIDDSLVRGTLHVTGREMTRQALEAGQSPQAAMRSALIRTSGTTTRLVLAGGRDTIIESSAKDKLAVGWARVTADKPCAFCALLAARGPVYTHETVDFKAHDHCSCAAEPHYRGSDWPGRGREFHDLYNRATSEASAAGDLRRGTSNDLLNAFRRAFDATSAD